MMYAEEALDPTALDQAGEAEWRTVQNHVKHCAICRSAVEQLRQEARGLSSALAMATSTSIEMPEVAMPWRILMEMV